MSSVRLTNRDSLAASLLLLAIRRRVKEVLEIAGKCNALYTGIWFKRETSAFKIEAMMQQRSKL